MICVPPKVFANLDNTEMCVSRALRFRKKNHPISDFDSMGQDRGVHLFHWFMMAFLNAT